LEWKEIRVFVTAPGDRAGRRASSSAEKFLGKIISRHGTPEAARHCGAMMSEAGGRASARQQQGEAG